MSKTKLDPDKYFAIIERADGRCEVCGSPLVNAQIAHRIPQRFSWIKREVIHHPLNLVVVCSHRCNDAASISNRPREIAELVDKIQKELEDGRR